MAHAYGIAVNFYMLLITSMVAYAAAKVWYWSLFKTFMIFILFFVIDIAFLFANVHKFLTGGWVPVTFALLIGFIMYAWSSSLAYLKEHFYLKQKDFPKLVKQLDYKSLNHLQGVTSVFISNVYDETGGGFLQFAKLSLSVPEHILIVSFVVENRPRVRSKKRFEVHPLSNTVCRLILHYGFMDTISIPDALKRAEVEQVLPFSLPIDTLTYVIDVPNIVPSKRKERVFRNSREKIFSFLMRNYSANLNMEFYRLPVNRTIVLGSYCIF
jgi:KUP system potassium uptake protein